MIRHRAMPHFDVVVIGSGYGGAVAAARAAAAGREVCVLERGRAYAPGSFPRTPEAIKQARWDPGRRLLGLFDVHDLGSATVLVASGLGGGSLIDSGVLTRAEQLSRPAAHGAWPLAPEELAPSYERVERELHAAPLPVPPPSTVQPSNGVRAGASPRAEALAAAAQRLGAELVHEPLAIRFGPDEGVVAPGDPLPEERPNLHGRGRYACRHVAECNLGCNYGAKDSLDFTLLQSAIRDGAELRTGVEAQSLRLRDESGYEIHFVEHERSEQVGVGAAQRRMTAGQVFLAAGALGSTRLLLNSRRALPALSPQLGAGFNLNGEALAVVEEVGFDPVPGTVTTTAVRLGSGTVYRDIGLSDHLVWVSSMLGMRLGGSRQFLLQSLDDHDVQTASLRSEGDQLRLEGQSLVARRELLNGGQSLVGAFDGGVLKPSSDVGVSTALQPLGGCPMGSSANDGVVDPWGRVFGLRGLYVCDGSIVPMPLGAPPALTIAALADRIASAALEETGNPREPAELRNA